MHFLAKFPGMNVLLLYYFYLIFDHGVVSFYENCISTDKILRAIIFCGKFFLVSCE